MSKVKGKYLKVRNEELKVINSNPSPPLPISHAPCPIPPNPCSIIYVKHFNVANFERKMLIDIQIKNNYLYP
jgi:hypothetical protein